MFKHLAEKEKPLAIDCNYLQWEYLTQVARGQNIKLGPKVRGDPG